MRRVAVTGASGFLGRHLLARLMRDGIDSVALSRRAFAVPGAVNVVVGDYLNVQRLASSLQGIDVVFHLAARAHRHDSADASASQIYTAANVETTVAVARACRRAGVGRLVFVSSIGVNGNRTTGRPFGASDDARPVEMYALSKWLAEQAIAAELVTGATDYAILRPPLIYGPGCPGNFERLIHWVAKGVVVPLGGLDAPRTFVYVENLVDALMLAARHPSASRRTFLIADGRDVSVSEIVRTLARALGRRPAAVWNLPAGVLRLLARLAGRSVMFAKLADPLQVDASEFHRATGWRAPFEPSVGLQLTAQGPGAAGR